MRTSCLTLFLYLLAGSTCPAQDWARAMFDHVSYDFGVIARGSKIEHRFPVENIYLEDMRIESIRSTCNCTTTQFSKQPLKTYEITEIVATIDTRKFLGRKEATLRVRLAEPFPAEVQLHVYCYIRSDVVFEPGSVQFGSVDQGTSTRRKVRISYAGRPDWEILDVQSACPHLKASVTSVSRSMGQVVYDLAVELREDAPVGYLKDHLILVTNDHNRDAARVPLAVEGIVTAAVSAGPSPLPLGVLRTGQAVTRNLVVRGKVPFRIVDATGPDERFQFELPDSVRPVHLIPVTFTAGDTAGKVAGVIHIRTDLTGSQALEVKVDGMVLQDESDNSEPPPDHSPEAGAIEPADSGGQLSGQVD